MIKTFAYNPTSTLKIKKVLENMKKQGVPSDYEVLIDDIKVIHRTSNIELFYQYQNHLLEDSREVSFVLYKGKSRRYDKYILVIKGSVSANPNMSTQAYIEREVAKAVKSHKHQLEFTRLQEENDEQKKKIEQLKQALSESQSKNGEEIKAILQLVQSQFLTNNSPRQSNEINGIPTEELAKMLLYYREQFGEEVIGDALGMALQVAKHPEIIEEVKSFINQKISKNENKKA